MLNRANPHNHLGNVLMSYISFPLFINSKKIKIMRAVYKYRVPVKNIGQMCVIDLPTGCTIVSFNFQGAHPHIWAEIDTTADVGKRSFIVYATGAKIEKGAKYIGTSHVDGFVWHLYELL